jgi:hypothetical protein
MSIWKHVFHLVIIFSLLFTAFFIFFEIFNIGLPFLQTITILTSGFLISLISLWMFLRGIQKENQKRIITTMSALGIKLLLFLVLLLIYYFLSKIQKTEFVITFFIIYLSFTYYLLKVFIQALKSKKIKE